MNVAQAQSVLGIDNINALTERALRRIYVEMVKKIHPDAGVESDAIIEVNIAYDILKSYMKSMDNNYSSTGINDNMSSSDSSSNISDDSSFNDDRSNIGRIEKNETPIGIEHKDNEVKNVLDNAERVRMRDYYINEHRDLMDALNKEVDSVKLLDINRNLERNENILRELNATMSEVEIKESNNIIKEKIDKGIEFQGINDILSQTSDEFIQGTNIKRPRTRLNNESDEDYVKFLEEYYNAVFAKREDKVSNEIIPINEKDISVDDFDPFKDIPPLRIEQKPKTIAIEQKDIPIGIEQKPDINKNDKESQNKNMIIWREVTNELLKGLVDSNTDKAGKKYTASNIKVTRSFKNELKNGNYLYNIVSVGRAVVAAGVRTINKYFSKFTLKEEDKSKIQEMEKRINNLSKDKVDVLLKAYRGGVINEECFPTIFNNLLLGRIKAEVKKKITERNNENVDGFSKIFADFKQVNVIDELLKRDDLTKEQKENLDSRRKNLLYGKSELVSKIRRNQILNREDLSSGLHGLEEDVKASNSKLNLQGKRFAKKGLYNEELEEKLLSYETHEKEAIENKDNYAAIYNFINREKTLAENTKMENSVFGKRSIGNKYYTPIIEEMDYRDDPFVRDLFTTVALTGAAISTVNAFVTQGKINDVINTQNRNADSINSNIDTVHKAGENITSKSDIFDRGLRSQAHQTSANIEGTMERTTSDMSNWQNFDSSRYTAMDNQSHAFFNGVYDDVNQSFADVTTKLQSGSIDSVTALEEVSKIASNAQGTATQVYAACKPYIEEYAKNHPSINLNSVNGTLDYFVNNPGAITEMNQAIVDVVKTGQSLSEVTLEHVAALHSLPSDIQTTLLGALSSSALAFNVASTMRANTKKGKYGNSVTDTVNKFSFETDREALNQMLKEAANIKGIAPEKSEISK